MNDNKVSQSNPTHAEPLTHLITATVSQGTLYLTVLMCEFVRRYM